MLLTAEEFAVMKQIIPSKRYGNVRMVIDIEQNQIIATDGFIAIQFDIDCVKNVQRELKKNVEKSCSVPIFQLKQLNFIQKIVHKKYADTVMVEGQLVPIDENIWYVIGDDTVILNNCTNLDEDKTSLIDGLIKYVDDSDRSLFEEWEPHFVVSKTKMRFDKVVEKCNKFAQYECGPEFTTSTIDIGGTIVKVIMRTPVANG